MAVTLSWKQPHLGLTGRIVLKSGMTERGAPLIRGQSSVFDPGALEMRRPRLERAQCLLLLQCKRKHFRCDLSNPKGCFFVFLSPVTMQKARGGQEGLCRDTGGPQLPPSCALWGVGCFPRLCLLGAREFRPRRTIKLSVDLARCPWEGCRVTPDREPLAETLTSEYFK